MRRSRFFCIFATVLLFAAAVIPLYACDIMSKELQFKNELPTAVNVYFSCAADDDWGEKPTRVGVKSGVRFGLNFSDFDGASGKKADIGAIDENSVNYDIYEVVLNEGDSIILSGNNAEAIFIITHADGTMSSFAAIITARGD